MIIEETTTYAYKLKYIENVSFNRIRAFAQSFVNELPQELVDDIYEQLNRGLVLLQNEPQMLVYLYSFGNMHQAKLNRAFEQLPDAFLQQPEIRIVDYGCGQAIGTMCYADYLADHGLSQTIKSVTLIEPSEICLKRAALHVSQFFPDAEIHTVCKTFDNLTDDDLANSADIPTLHILSNVLDIQAFDLEDFATLIDNNLNNYNQFVCVGPYFSYSDKDERMTRFAELLNGNVSYSKVFERGELISQKDWTCHSFVFSVSKKKLTHIERCIKEAKDGDAETQYGLGLGYYYGYNNHNHKVDYKKAFIWFTRAAKQGHIEAQIYLADCYYNGQGVSQDYEKAVKWYIKAAKEGDSDAQYKLGNCYYNGKGVALNYEKAVEWYIKAAEQDCAEAQSQLGYCFCNGKGVKKDCQKAFKWWAAAEDFSIPNCIMDEYGVVYSNNGKGLLMCFNKELESYDIRKGTIVIFEWAFAECKELKQITIPNSVKRIMNNAFENCLNLQQITIPDSVKSIGSSAFEQCESLQRITIPKSISRIERGTFGCCKSLLQIDLPDTIISIEDGAFAFCESLQQITIPNSVKEIGKGYYWCKYRENLVGHQYFGTFYGCKKLQEITIPEFVTKIEGGLFCGNDKLHLKSQSARFVIRDDMFIDIKEHTLISYIGNSKSLIIPNSIKSIGCKAFWSCKSLQQIIIPNSVTDIGEGAFANCISLRQITLPNHITIINNGVFAGCKTLCQIIIPDLVESIGFAAFKGCVLLQYISIPNTVTSIGGEAFEHCKKLIQVEIPNGVTYIGNRAFYGCKSLRQINIPDRLEQFGMGVFDNCDSLPPITIPNTVELLF